MEKHKCKLCLKSFANGRALGGHMRSHMLNLYVNPKPQHRHSPPSSEEEEEAGDENPKKRFRLRDPESSFAAGGGGVSVILQDRESETESSRNATFRRRSKRIRRRHFHEFNHNEIEKSKVVKKSTLESLSSISDTSSEEEIAYCLMMLSRDRWTDNESESESERTPARTKYRCETCNRIFRSYQALGGHKASHKKVKIDHQPQNVFMEGNIKIHECPVCLKVFSSGQALGGHKRSHSPANPIEKQSINHIDLNLPAPIEDDEDEVSQIEVSVVSDGEFVKNQ